jgi:integrase
VKLCTKCRSLDSGAAVFTPERILADPSLERAKAILDAADGDYLARMIKAGGPWSLLKEVVTSPGPIVHDRLDKAGTASSTRSLRAFLVAVGILPPRNEALHALEEWVVRRSELIRGTEDRNAFIRFARWRHLRRSRTGPLNSAQADGHRYELSVVFAYIDDLHTHGRTLRTATQQHLERWLAAGTPERRRVNLFLNWCRTSSINRNLNPPIRLRSASSLTPRRLAEATQAELLSTMLAPETPLDPALRLAASLVLLYGIRTHQIVGLRTSDIIEDGRGTSVRIGDEPLRLPTALAGWAQQIGSASVVGRFGGRSRDAEWIFPSPLHGRAVSPQTLGNRLRAIGVSPGDARGSAVSQLALQLPPAVLSRLLGVAPRTATGWVAAVSASQSRYVPAVLGR